MKDLFQWQHLFERARWWWSIYPRSHEGGGFLMGIYHLWNERFTTMGKIYLGALFFGLLLESFPGIAPGILLWTCFLSLFIGAFLYLRFHFSSLTVSAFLQKRTTVGTPTNFTLQVQNTGTKMIERISANEFRLPDHLTISNPNIWKAFLAPNESKYFQFHLSANKRGLYRIKGAWALQCDPLFLLQKPFFQANPIDFIVHPKAIPIKNFSIKALQTQNSNEDGYAKFRPGLQKEFAGLRKYQAGDMPRDIDHKAWARQAQPIVRQYESTSHGKIDIIFDDSIQTFWNRHHFETTVNLCASVLEKLKQHETPISSIHFLFESLPDVIIQEEMGPDILDALAMITPKKINSTKRHKTEVQTMLRNCTNTTLFFSSWYTSNQLEEITLQISKSKNIHTYCTGDFPSHKKQKFHVINSSEFLSGNLTL